MATVRDHVVKQGFLKKISEPQSSVIQSLMHWETNRWFVFGVREQTRPYLEYYDREENIFQDKPAINSFDLTCCQKVTYTLGRMNRNYTFCIFLPDRVLQLKAQSRELMIDWCACIESTLSSLGLLDTYGGDHIYVTDPVELLKSHQKKIEVSAAGSAEDQSQNTADIPQGGVSVPQVNTSDTSTEDEAATVQLLIESRKKTLRKSMVVSGSSDDAELGGLFHLTNATVPNDSVYEFLPDIPLCNEIKHGDQIEEPVTPNEEQPPSAYSVACGSNGFPLQRWPQEQEDINEDTSGLLMQSSSLTSSDSDCATVVQGLTIKHIHVKESLRNECSLTHTQKVSVDETETIDADLPPPLPRRTFVPRPLTLPPSYFSANSILECDTNDKQSENSEVLFLHRNFHQLSRRQQIIRASAVVSLRQTQVELLKEEMSCEDGITIALTKLDIQNIAFVECFDQIWVAGWNQRECPSLFHKLHIGDRLVSINKVLIEKSSWIKKIAKNSGVFDVLVQRIPYGHVFSIKRSFEGESLGFKLEQKNGEIVYVDPFGLAAKHDVPSKSWNVSHDGRSNWILTEVNSRPLNLFSANSDIEHRLNSVGNEISILIHPADFVKSLKKQLKKLKNYKIYLIW